jgi:hypothetical protein
MTRGLSANQLKILGTAYHSNLITQHGMPKVKGELGQNQGEELQPPVSDFAGPKDINWILAAVVVYGAELNRAFGIEQSPYFGLLVPTMPTREKDGVPVRIGAVKSDRLTSIKPNAIRNISSLVRRGMLAPAPDNTIAREGYVLTVEGFKIGEQHEVAFDPALYLACRTLISPDGNFHNDALFFHLTEVAREEGLSAGLKQLAAYNRIGSNKSLEKVRPQREWIVAHIGKWQERWRDEYGALHT